ncbi:MAG: hypothetical protein GVY13_17775 [Alphaproteobacteria bacterium]|jgi:hypothetical protein|nr:hypothetical protein [Alphaproteobacteria bacterium]
MRSITGTYADVRRKLQELNVPDNQEMTVTFDTAERGQALQEIMDEMSDQAERNGLTDLDIMNILEIDEEQFQNIFGHSSTT